MEINVKDTALIIEGGGMRASYTSGLINVLLENGINFGYVAGVSAGASCAVNYLSRDMDRVRRSFVDLAGDPRFGGWRYFLRGKGYFHSDYIYDEIARSDGAMPFDFETFRQNPATLRIGAFSPEKNDIVFFSKKDMETREDVMKIVRASSTLPVVMPPTEYKGRIYYDGGLMGGIAVEEAIRDGYSRFFALLSRSEGYFKSEAKNPDLIRKMFRRCPEIADAILQRWQHYNRQKEMLLALRNEGRAFLVFPESMLVGRGERDTEKLRENYELGYDQGNSQLDEWKSFLFGRQELSGKGLIQSN